MSTNGHDRDPTERDARNALLIDAVKASQAVPAALAMIADELGDMRRDIGKFLAEWKALEERVRKLEDR